MNRFTTKFLICVMVCLLTSCATTEDVKRATTLIRTDNELTRLLVEVRPEDKSGVATHLLGMATRAEEEAAALIEEGGDYNNSDAIAYYRIAATAYWRSGDPNVASELFEIVDKGTQLCTQLKENAPDRDCLFLQLVIPFAGLESTASPNGLPRLLTEVDFANDGVASQEEVDTMDTIQKLIHQTRDLVEKIFAIGKDDRLLTHSSMGKYYCDNAIKAKKYFEDYSGDYLLKVREYHDEIPNNTPPLGVTVDEASELIKLKKDVPAFCKE